MWSEKAQPMSSASGMAGGSGMVCMATGSSSTCSAGGVAVGAGSGHANDEKASGNVSLDGDMCLSAGAGATGGDTLLTGGTGSIASGGQVRVLAGEASASGGTCSVAASTGGSVGVDGSTNDKWVQLQQGSYINTGSC